ncbi:LysM peptidoglycan-binding domain-containing protein [Streptomyces sp. NPDC086033]|uniref:LysM peptidoglycan-binding domain-containing protein n=1 Tax=Streptomyces sp. NPDC086033 TaxID=3365747 RepID=UPI0037D3E41A
MTDDWLSKLAVTYLGNANRYPEIYKANEAVIEAAARDHGYPNSRGGDLIFPGTVLAIPGAACAPMDQTLRQRLEEELLIATGLSRTDARLFLEQLGSCLTSIGLRKAVSKIKDPDERKKWANIIKTEKFDLGLSQTEAGDIWEGVRVAIVTFVPGTGCVLFKPTPAGG